MLLSQLLHKRVFVGKTPRGTIAGITFSLKNYAVKHLLCSLRDTFLPPLQCYDFAINFPAVNFTGDITLKKLHPVLPRAQAKLFLGLPVYTHDGIFLGELADGEWRDFTLTRLTTDKHHEFAPSDIAVCRDALFLRKKHPFPLGQRVPSPLLSSLRTAESTVTKPLLRRAIQQGALIKLTLSLPPFVLSSDQ